VDTSLYRRGGFAKGKRRAEKISGRKGAETEWPDGSRTRRVGKGLRHHKGYTLNGVADRQKDKGTGGKFTGMGE